MIPACPVASGTENRVDLRVDDETYSAILRIADQNNRKISDVVRGQVPSRASAGSSAASLVK